MYLLRFTDLKKWIQMSRVKNVQRGSPCPSPWVGLAVTGEDSGVSASSVSNQLQLPVCMVMVAGDHANPGLIFLSLILALVLAA